MFRGYIGFGDVVCNVKNIALAFIYDKIFLNG